MARIAMYQMSNSGMLTLNLQKSLAAVSEASSKGADQSWKAIYLSSED